ncbi:hypothetical protein AJ85_20355 [Alkalihalobacillus alcalophilus ATCC 27647 = CGMCC 1.3604]|uniref:Uncharacterized protein n=1 Tax=Alkalihalobacillus alcalophilus ATCC 27647 = CGMCC 1.3604 TaxID=1218173 RepID=A0A4S4JUY8_ALKAL|nr:hypothetical protein [Alkalihalobacillus alcalophilus]MED1563420.1 hypothetical protein [Alkalihalobacillus alcalophilus]THG88963.1 hypothetical protein AJ85_20355 [Alkalihalobacillus alcalophilus ATCC 27647 = CGMCC 1.3604]
MKEHKLSNVTYEEQGESIVHEQVMEGYFQYGPHNEPVKQEEETPKTK